MTPLTVEVFASKAGSATAGNQNCHEKPNGMRHQRSGIYDESQVHRSTLCRDARIICEEPVKLFADARASEHTFIHAQIAMLQRGTRRTYLCPLLEYAKMSAVAVLSHHVTADHKKRGEKSKESISQRKRT